MKDLLIRNGNIYTMDEEHPTAHSVYIANGKIEEVDPEDEVKLLKRGIEVLDLDGRVMLPGFHDSHLHMLLYGINKMDGVDLSGAESVEEIQELLSDYIKTSGKEAGSWVVGYGWNHENFADKRMPCAADLDEVSTEHYIVIKRICIHIASVNSKLLELCGIDENTYRASEHIGRQKDGRPDGLIYEDAISNVVMCEKPPYDSAEIEDILLRAMERLKSCGFTAVQTDDMKTFSDFGSKVNILKAYDNLRNKGKMPVRIMEQLQVTDLRELKALLLAAENIKNDDIFSIQLVKLILDGSLGGWTAAVSKPYRDSKDTLGILNFTDSEIAEIADFCYENDMQMAFHCIGDRAIEQVLNVVRQMKSKYGKDLRPRIVHCQLSRDEQLREMAELGILADIQPMFVPSDYRLVSKRLEEESQKAIYAWKRLLNYGVSLSGSSDSPVESYEPFYGIRAAVCRTDLENQPQGGWKPEEKLSVSEAIALYTKGAAYSAGREEELGCIKKGYYSDFVIISEDPYKIEAENLHKIKIEQVVFSGR